MLVGGTEATLNTPSVNAFVRSGILSQQLPFWHDNVIKRDCCVGSVLSDGACVLVLEEYERAVRRGAPIFAELLSSGMSTDGFHMVLPHPSGRGVSLAIRQAIMNAGIQRDDIDFVMGHFPGVKLLYDIEMRVFKREFGKRLSQIPITNIKPLIGYTQGACSAFEVASACLAFQEPIQWISYGFKHTPIQASCALVNCIGFGGKNASLIVRKVKK